MRVQVLTATGMLKSDSLVSELGSVSVDLETFPELTAAESATPNTPDIPTPNEWAWSISAISSGKASIKVSCG